MTNYNFHSVYGCSREPQTMWVKETDHVLESEPELRDVKMQLLRLSGSVFSGPLPLINRSNYLPQPQECAGRAAPWPLMRWEAPWCLGGSTNKHQPTHTTNMKEQTLRDHHLIWRFPSTNTLLWPRLIFCFVFGINKTGSTKLSVSKQPSFHHAMG